MFFHVQPEFFLYLQAPEQSEHSHPRALLLQILFLQAPANEYQAPQVFLQNGHCQDQPQQALLKMKLKHKSAEKAQLI